MLILSRRIGEEIVISDNIRLTILADNGKRIRLGITAPSSIPVIRMELLSGCTRPPSATGCMGAGKRSRTVACAQRGADNGQSNQSSCSPRTAVGRSGAAL